MVPCQDHDKDGLLWGTDHGHRTALIDHLVLSATGHAQFQNTICLTRLVLLYSWTKILQFQHNN